MKIRLTLTTIVLAGLLVFITVVAQASVGLARFEGWWQDNHVKLEWETADEHDHGGFDLYRHPTDLPLDQVASQATKLNSSIITQGTDGSTTICTPTGNLYDFDDDTADPAQGAYHYWLASYPCVAGSPTFDEGAHICVLIGDLVNDTGNPPPDGKLTIEDLVHLAGYWHQTTGLPPGADNDGDGKVTVIELSRSAMHLGTACFQ